MFSWLANTDFKKLLSSTKYIAIRSTGNSDKINAIYQHQKIFDLYFKNE